LVVSQWGCVVVIEGCLRRLKTFVVLAWVLILTACGGDASRFEAAVQSSKIDSLSVVSLRDVSQRGETQPFTAQASLKAGGEEDVTTRVAWSVSDPAIASIDASGLLTALTDGSVEVIARLGNLSARKTLVINDATLETLALAPVTADPCIGVQLDAIGHYSDGSDRNVRDRVRWSVAAPSTIVGDGRQAGFLVPRKSSGTISVVIDLDGVMRTALVPVDDSLVAIDVSPTAKGLKVGETLRYQALGKYSGSEAARDISADVLWSSSDVSRATIDDSGLVTAVSEGVTTIAAVCGERRGESVLTVTAGGSNTRLEFLLDGVVLSGSLERNSQRAFDLHLRRVEGATVEDVTESASWSIIQHDPGLSVAISDVRGSKGRVTVSGQGDFVVKVVYQNETRLLPVTIMQTLTPPAAPG